MRPQKPQMTQMTQMGRVRRRLRRRAPDRAILKTRECGGRHSYLTLSFLGIARFGARPKAAARALVWYAELANPICVICVICGSTTEALMKKVWQSESASLGAVTKQRRK